jgi:hypothetical protein
MITNFFLWLFFMALSCTEGELTESNSCGVLLTENPTLQSEHEISLYATPLSDTWDTYVTIDGFEAEVISIQRLGCSSCDTCRLENLCDSCETCDECTALCDTSVCFEELNIYTPILSVGTATLQIINKYGHSPQYELSVVEESQ